MQHFSNIFFTFFTAILDCPLFPPPLAYPSGSSRLLLLLTTSPLSLPSCLPLVGLPSLAFPPCALLCFTLEFAASLLCIRMLSVACCVLYVACRMLRIVYCVSDVAYRMLRVVCCVSYVEYRILRIGSCVSDVAWNVTLSRSQHPSISNPLTIRN